jgi:hypothetical protein
MDILINTSAPSSFGYIGDLMTISAADSLTTRLEKSLICRIHECLVEISD